MAKAKNIATGIAIVGCLVVLEIVLGTKIVGYLVVLGTKIADYLGIEYEI